ncbi:MAG: hypothetical protein ACT4NY_34500 [Pseudonocardiales bacterium]
MDRDDRQYDSCRSVAPLSLRKSELKTRESRFGPLDARMARDQWLARWQAAAGDVDPKALDYARRALTGERAFSRVGGW